jgi:putative transposase
MNIPEFEHWCRRLQLPVETINLIGAIRTAEPSRKVQGRAKNVSGVYPSRKMGLTIQFESHTVELWAIYQMEHDPKVLEFYDQPPPFKIQYKNQAGRNIGHYHTPDFFVLREEGACWEEWKTEKELEKLAQKYPSRYYQTSEGVWRCPPGEAHASKNGLKYVVRSSASLNPVFTQNLMFLEDYFGCDYCVQSSVANSVLSRIKAKPGITIAQILSQGDEVRADDLYVLIARTQIYVDLYAAPLAEHWRVHLFPDSYTHDAMKYVVAEQYNSSIIRGERTKLLPNTVLTWDLRLWTLVNFGETTTTLLPEVGTIVQLPTPFFLQLFDSGTINILATESELSINEVVGERMDAASPADFKEANYRFYLVQAYFQHHKEIYENVKPRTLRRWVKQFREAEAIYGCGYVGLLPRTSKRGNRSSKAPTQSTELLDKFITDYFETPRQVPAASVYRAYRSKCDDLNIEPLSSRTFYQRLKKRPIHEQTLKRRGAKAAYSTEPFVLELTLTTPRHGDRPFAIVHIDHTQLDIELRSQATGRLLGRPWLTLMIDAYSRRILAAYLTFDAPSYRTCMMGLRILVQRFGRFPQTVVVDGGKEFHSVYFDTLLARYHCVKKTRPGGKSRFGSVIERLFGTTNTEFVYNLLGNTQASKQARQLTPSVNPKELAVWTLGDLYTRLADWTYQIYDHLHHDSLGASPERVYTDGIKNSGSREHLRISYNEEFLMITRPSTSKGNALVQPGQGIKVNYIYYWNDAFRNPSVEKTSVPVRYDPFDMGAAYAYVEGRWVKCISQYYSIFAGHTEKEVLLAAQEIKHLNKRTGISQNLNAKRLADFIASVQEHEVILLQRLRDLDSKRVLENLTNYKEETSSTSQVIPVEPHLSRDTSDVVTTTGTQNVEPLDVSLLPVLGEYK